MQRLLFLSIILAVKAKWIKTVNLRLHLSVKRDVSGCLTYSSTTNCTSVMSYIYLVHHVLICAISGSLFMKKTYICFFLLVLFNFCQTLFYGGKSHFLGSYLMTNGMLSYINCNKSLLNWIWIGDRCTYTLLSCSFITNLAYMAY